MLPFFQNFADRIGPPASVDLPLKIFAISYFSFVLALSMRASRADAGRFARVSALLLGWRFRRCRRDLADEKGVLVQIVRDPDRVTHFHQATLQRVPYVLFQFVHRNCQSPSCRTSAKRFSNRGSDMLKFRVCYLLRNV